ncbi:MAG: hypothetical protein A3J09_02620 [Candidatus Zambryskibacteria bacterium RIFCSPLOWO2_02_FULL_51_21]|uniref:site-specific DNA-methyltransferase (adenine-specific) n=1 Tax=Candidatus Zambryskibacteria bacterium RIFCSPHIGHO2_02_FULL_43_37 TaxID=1802749 RepID=A0A1G2TI78_9BACT|nr:MAG: hypothetical protein A2723_02610 [Candidatus Zambryskibacteria bacterium RIFCSPHIGHO2_01_FULL_52_18]OHA96321.1 MAG: hypothetical protein A3D49_00280 [Candidatus Zambryskibacteria bacterium RIFCSPHIGHO2_02_FULL_43_37]OHB07724.1 MAG: hypothetical protein A2944_00155 [Candidatus Zambryskibacteria bacterium RIFCSPLOWO2_01_FULL_52_12]OHB11420.1 MAG: hypothetical protein A3J09_02620 [Candidatus Zambryskibacteria bacterium RIFCSPLOWO2_02_FULL_51_21]
MSTPIFTKTLESATRKKIDLILANLGWNTDETSPDCNVFTERAKTTEQNKKFKGKNPDYVLYKSGTDDPIGIIEAKRSGQSLRQALNQAINLYAEPLGLDIIFVTDGSIVESHDVRSKSNLKLDDQIITEFISEKQLLKFLEHGSQLYSPEKITYTKRELIKIFSEANDLLRKEGIREGIERFAEFSNLLFLKLISEIEEDRENSGEQRILEKKYCWESFYKLDPDRMLEYVNNIILPRLVNKYNHSGDVFQQNLLIKSPENLKKIVDKLSSLKLLDADSDIKGDAFEYFLKNSVSVGTDLGEYFTPRHIVKLIVDLVDPKFGDKIYDPACGTGGFLIEAFRHIKNKCKQTKENLQILKEKTVYGREISGTAKIAKMNMIIIGDGHNNIKQMDSLKNPVKGDYNVVLTNFPFSQTTDYSAFYGFNSEDANPVFLKHIIDSLDNGGIAGVVVPEGLLFDENSEYIKIRKILLETCNVVAVIKLHEFVFKPYTGQPTSILIFEKGRQTQNVWFFDVQEDGFKKTGSKLGRSPIEANDLILLRQIWKDKENSNHSFSVDFKKIVAEKYKLSMDKYRKQGKKTTDFVKLGEVCDIVIGGTPSRKDLSLYGGKNLWVKIRDMNRQMYISNTEEKITDKGVKESNVKLLPIDTLLFSFKLTIGKVAITAKELYTNEAIAGIVPKDNRVLTKYLYYLLPRLDYSTYSQRATKGKTLNKDIMRIVEIPLPSVEIQKKIIKELDAKESEKEKHLQAVAKIAEDQDKKINELI